METSQECLLSISRTYTGRLLISLSFTLQAVHDKGGVFFLQLFHAGRSSHHGSIFANLYQMCEKCNHPQCKHMGRRNPMTAEIGNSVTL